MTRRACFLGLVLVSHSLRADWVYSSSVPVPPMAIAADANGNAYVVGGDGVTVSKLDPAGKIVFTTSLAAPSGAIVNAIAVDAGGNIYVTGSTESAKYPVTPGVLQAQLKPGKCQRGLIVPFPGTPPVATMGPCADAFVAKFDAAGKLVFSTYLGGTEDDTGLGIAVDDSGSIYVTGSTGSDDFPVRNPFQATRTSGSCMVFGSGPFNLSFTVPCQSFVAKIAPDGSALTYATYLPFGNGSLPFGMQGFGTQPLAVDADGNVYLTAGRRIARLNSAGNSLDTAEVSTDTGPIVVTTIAVDTSGNVYAAGGSIGTFGVGDKNAFVSKLGPDFGKPLYFASFLGNGLPERMAVDALGRAIVAGTTGLGGMPVRGGAFSSCHSSGFVAMVTADGSDLVVSGYSNWSRQAVFAATADDTVYIGGGYAGPIVKIAGIDTLTRPAVLSECVRDNTLSAVGGISPGEVITIYGSNLGPAQAASYQLNASGRIDSTLAGTRVTFDGVAAPLLYVQDRQINVVTPYELAGKSETVMLVEYGGHKSDPLTLGVTDLRPELFNSFDTRSPIVQSEDGNPISCKNPAAPGSLITFFATGAGQTNPPSVDGQIGTDAAQGLKASVRVIFGDVDAEVVHAGPIQGVVTAVQEFKVRVPPVSGNAVGVTLMLDGVPGIPYSTIICVSSN